MSESVHLFANAFKNSKLINFANLWDSFIS